MKKINVAVIGANGRMGQEIAAVLSQHKKLSPFLAVSRKGKASGFQKTSNTLKTVDFKNVDAVIDFSTKENFKAVVDFCVENNLPLVSGTTGVEEKDLNSLSAAGKKIPLLWASNMSIGVATLAKALRALSAIKDFDFQIEEFHHIHKKDKPSGTAISLQKVLEKAVGKKCPAPVAIRGGGIFGIHKIYAMSEDEVLVFEHSALNRKVFAQGAVKVAAWLVGQKPGVYEIQDMIEG